MFLFNSTHKLSLDFLCCVLFFSLAYPDSHTLRWWKINVVFDKIAFIKDRTGPVLLLEEDYFVAPDILPTVALFYEEKQRVCPECLFVGVGNYGALPDYAFSNKRAQIFGWTSNLHNMGLVIDRSSWEKLKRCTTTFCKYDDYNWDWSLQNLGVNCIVPMKILLAVNSRVSHIGTCGAHAYQHSPGKPCDPYAAALSLRSLYKENEKYFVKFAHKKDPTLWKLDGVLSSDGYVGPAMPNGGWGDTRDHELCIQHAS